MRSGTAHARAAAGQLSPSRSVVGRQPILDRRGLTYGYELLYRDNIEAIEANFVDGSVATAQVLVNSMTEIGLEHLVGDRLAFVNLTADYLTSDELLNTVPADRVVFEVLEEVEPTEEVLAGLRRLSNLGFSFAADDFVATPHRMPLLRHMSYVKYVLGTMPEDELRAAIERDHAEGRVVVLEAVETAAAYELGMDLGADLFQGYYFARPVTVTTTSVAPNLAVVVEMLVEVSDPEARLADVADALSRDVALSVRALRYINSASVGLLEPVDSIAQAASMIGRDRLRSWGVLAMLASVGQHPDELGIVMLTRARACSDIAKCWGTIDPETAYTVGMLSLVDVMVGASMAGALETMPVSDEVRAALIDQEGPLHDLLDLVNRIEGARDSEDIPFPLVKIYFDAVCWAQQFRSEVGDNV